MISSIKKQEQGPEGALALESAQTISILRHFEASASGSHGRKHHQTLSQQTIFHHQLVHDNLRNTKS